MEDKEKKIYLADFPKLPLPTGRLTELAEDVHDWAHVSIFSLLFNIFIKFLIIFIYFRPTVWSSAPVNIVIAVIFAKLRL